MANLYHLPELPPEGAAVLSGDVAHHLLRVLRVRPGDQLTLCDGRGRTAAATVQATSKAELTADVAAATLHPRVRPHVTLAFACPRPARADWLLEHGTEVGVGAFQPLWTARSRPQSVRTDRWRKITAAAAGQCARPYLPEVREPLELSSLLAGELPEARFVASQGAAPLAAPAGAQDALVLIGPEGGLDDAEQEAAEAAGLCPASLGPHILRTETAALVAAAALLRGAE